MRWSKPFVRSQSASGAGSCPAHGRPPAQRFQQSEQRIAVFSAGNGNQDPVALRDEVEVRHGASHVMQKVTFDKLRRPASRLPSLYTLHEAAHCAHVLL